MRRSKSTKLSAIPTSNLPPPQTDFSPPFSFSFSPPPSPPPPPLPTTPARYTHLNSQPRCIRSLSSLEVDLGQLPERRRSAISITTVTTGACTWSDDRHATTLANNPSDEPGGTLDSSGKNRGFLLQTFNKRRRGVGFWRDSECNLAI